MTPDPRMIEKTLLWPESLPAGPPEILRGVPKDDCPDTLDVLLPEPALGREQTDKADKPNG